MSKFVCSYQFEEGNCAIPNSYCDNKINIKFYVRIDRIYFDLTNKTSKSLKINWNESVMIIDSVVNKIAHVGVKSNITSEDVLPYTIIPPFTTIKDFIIPIPNIKVSLESQAHYFMYTLYICEYTDVNILPLFPLNFSINTGLKDYSKQDITNLQNSIIKNYIGRRILLYLTIFDDNTQSNYTFNFIIKEIKKN
jgi:hypothetical protein